MMCGGLPSQPKGEKEGNLPPQYEYSRTVTYLLPAWNTSSDVLPLDPSASDLRSFFFCTSQTSSTTHHHSPVNRPFARASVRPRQASGRHQGSGDGCRQGVRTKVTQGRPKQGQDRYSHLSEVAYSHHPIEDNAKSTWLDSKPGKKNAPRRWGTPTILSIRITRRSIVYMVRSQTHYLRE